MMTTRVGPTFTTSALRRAIPAAVALGLVAGLPQASYAETKSATPAPSAPATPSLFTPRTRPSFQPRHSWFLGASLGFGTASYEADEYSSSPIAETGALATLDLRFGGMLTPRLALAVEYWSDGHSYRDERLVGQSFDASLVQNSFAVTASYWVTPRLWLSTGLGASSIKAYYTATTEEVGDGVSAMVAIGYELLSRERYAIDVSLRLISSSYSGYEELSRSTFGLRLGLSWFR